MSKMKVWVLSIHHSYGENLSVHESEEAAHAAVTTFCREWWGEQYGDKPMPSDEQELRALYFEAADNEYATIEPSEIEISQPGGNGVAGSASVPTAPQLLRWISELHGAVADEWDTFQEITSTDTALQLTWLAHVADRSGATLAPELECDFEAMWQWEHPGEVHTPWSKDA